MRRLKTDISLSSVLSAICIPFSVFCLHIICASNFGFYHSPKEILLRQLADQNDKAEIATPLRARNDNKVNVLNLFGYTGIASLACAKAGASVTHVDASKPAISWARENQELCRRVLTDKPLFIVVNAYAITASAIMLENVLAETVEGLGGEIESGELALREKHGERLLSTGIFSRWSAF